MDGDGAGEVGVGLVWVDVGAGLSGRLEAFEEECRADVLGCGGSTGFFRTSGRRGSEGAGCQLNEECTVGDGFGVPELKGPITNPLIPVASPTIAIAASRSGCAAISFATQPCRSRLTTGRARVERCSPIKKSHRLDQLLL